MSGSEWRRGNRADEAAEVQRLRGIVRGLNSECHLEQVHRRHLETMLADANERCQEAISAVRDEERRRAGTNRFYENRCTRLRSTNEQQSSEIVALRHALAMVETGSTGDHKDYEEASLDYMDRSTSEESSVDVVVMRSMEYTMMEMKDAYAIAVDEYEARIAHALGESTVLQEMWHEETSELKEQLTAVQDRCTRHRMAVSYTHLTLPTNREV